eukprot:462380-Pyramimonas_sp.AAC.1
MDKITPGLAPSPGFLLEAARDAWAPVDVRTFGRGRLGYGTRSKKTLLGWPGGPAGPVRPAGPVAPARLHDLP